MDALSPMELAVCLIPAVLVIAVAATVIYAVRRKPTTTSDSSSQAVAPRDSQASDDIGNVSGISTSAETAQSGLAITSLVFGVLTIPVHFLFGITWSGCTGPLAMLIGVIALLRISKQGSKGKGIAIAGILLGTLPFVITFVAVLLIAATSGLNQ